MKTYFKSKLTRAVSKDYFYTFEFLSRSIICMLLAVKKKSPNEMLATRTFAATRCKRVNRMRVHPIDSLCNYIL